MREGLRFPERDSIFAETTDPYECSPAELVFYGSGLNLAATLLLAPIVVRSYNFGVIEYSTFHPHWRRGGSQIFPRITFHTRGWSRQTVLLRMVARFFSLYRLMVIFYDTMSWSSHHVTIKAWIGKEGIAFSDIIISVGYYLWSESVYSPDLEQRLS